MSQDIFMNYLKSAYYTQRTPKMRVHTGNIVDHFEDLIEERYKTYNRVLEACHERINFAYKKNQYKCIYVIPAIIYGKPLLKKMECLTYIIFKLRKNGFMCNYMEPNLLSISWEKMVKKRLRSRFRQRLEDPTDSKKNRSRKKKSAKAHFQENFSALMMRDDQ